MITRPLDLASKLRPEPRNFDWLFFVNGGVIALFFALFGSQFVLSPGVGVEFALPTPDGGGVNAKRTTHAITVLSSGLIITSDGYKKMEQLEAWFAERAKSVVAPVLLVQGDRRVPIEILVGISGSAKKAGFQEVLWATGESGPRKAQGDR